MAGSANDGGEVAKKSSLTLVDLISSLPEEERIVLVLHFVKNFSTAQIAEKLGVPERSVIAVLASGRSRLSAAFNFPQAL